MKNLLIPMAGKSSRFPNMRPKWMLTHPDTNNLMCVESLKGLDLDFFDIIYFTFLKEHEDKFSISIGLKKCIEDAKIKTPVKFVILDNNTKSQSETVYETIKKENIEGYIFIKDSDGFFEVQFSDTENKICFANLENTEVRKVTNKSYLHLDTNNLVLNIVEKKVISPYFSVGGYGFKSSEEFCSSYEKLRNLEGECYISNVVFEMILSDNKFKAVETFNFVDWGTLEDWRLFCDKFMTIFIDIDGTLITNSSMYIPPFIGDGTPIVENINTINNLFKSGNVKIILTTSRPKSKENETKRELDEHNILYHELIMGLPHAKRVLINDFSQTNKYPTALSINLERNSKNLENFI